MHDGSVALTTRRPKNRPGPGTKPRLPPSRERWSSACRTRHVHHELVCVREQMGDEAALLATLDRAIAAVPDDVVFHLVRYDRRRRRGDTEGAAADRTRLQELGYEGDLPGATAE